ncbi:putative sphingomyelinase family protein [Talaromyces proteolyticus]|uniref:Sphingomyelinase family protein n=1 Tax=Talaromyces proteolyticus TaxID=1131652 RepID=A0AAD4L2S8_9EURO|nr:putative sphingomyelinase family protein [Talaromyces proteolyticus]KAH8705561.1 putative sphingomyelinase family protein [Talaromyces proteolyticus]
MANSTETIRPTRIRILTLNCWGLKFLSKFRNERLSEIGRQIAIASEPPEIVGLQECWSQQDYKSIHQQTKHLLPYGKFYHSGVFGGGLAILSKWPIEESSMFAYPLNGRPTAFFRGDWYVGKGVACARIRMGPRTEDIAEVFCTHLHAPYEKEPNDSYLCHRTAQAWEISKLMRRAAERGHLVIGLGDFNMVPMSFAHRLITAHAPVKDVWHYLHPDSSVGSAESAAEKKRGKPIPSADFNITENGAASDGPYNTWRWPKEQQKRLFKGEDIPVDGTQPDPRGRRLDYIFVGDGGYPPSFPTPRWNIDSAAVAMMQRHPTLKVSLSDHFAIEAVISRSLDPAITAPADPEMRPTEPQNPDDGGFTVQTSSKTHPTSAPSTSLTTETYDEILEMVDKYMLRERSQRRWRLLHFVISVIVSIGCFVGVWWTSDVIYVAFILTFVSTLNFGAGILDGLIGGLFMSSEIRALKEFRWEVRNARCLAGVAAELVSKGASDFGDEED